MSEQKKMLKDVRKFIEKFEPNKYILLSSGIDVRGMTSFHDALESARNVIDKFQIHLMMLHTAEMVG